jgi:hypothetical protein
VFWAAIGGQTQGAIPVGILYLVDSTGDGDLVGPSTICDDGTGHCTLRAAIEASNLHSGFDGIAFNIPTTDSGYSKGTWTISLSKALPDISDAVDITGLGANKLIVQRLHGNVTDQGPNFRVFNVTTSGSVSISGMTIKNGSVGTIAGPGDLGGGIQNYNAGTVNLTNCTVTANYSFGVTTLGGGGGIANRAGGIINISNSMIDDNGAGLGSGIYNGTSGTLNVTKSTFYFNGSAESGGGIYNLGKTSITNSTFELNDAGTGGAIYNYVGTVNVTRSTIGPHNGAENGGGIYNDDYATVNITESTIAYNSAQQEQTTGNGGGIYNKAALNVTNSTIAVNAALSVLSCDCSVYGGGIYNDIAGTATIKSTIIAKNEFYASGEGEDVYGSFVSEGYNLIGIRDGSTGFNLATDQTGTCAGPNPGCNAALEPQFEFDSYGPLLKNNGGPTKTIALLPYSPAIDRGTNDGLTGTLTTDQRGSPRTFDYSFVPNVSCFDIHHILVCSGNGDGTDVGAVEFGGPFVPISVSRKTHGRAGPFDIYLVGNLVSPFAIEDRTGGPSQVLIDFPETVTVSSVSLSAGTATVSSFSVNGGQVTVNLTGVANVQEIVLTLSGVSNGTTTKNVSIPIGVLLGDAGNDGAVDSTDVSETQSLSLSGQPVNGSNFRFDVNHDGFINSVDVKLVQSKVGTHLP